MGAIATDGVVWSVCVSVRVLVTTRNLQKWLNRSICHLGKGKFARAKGTVY